MDKIGDQKLWSYFDNSHGPRIAKNPAIRGGPGHTVKTYFELATKVAELQFRNREHVLLFRGQNTDHCTVKGNSTLKATLFRLDGAKRPTPSKLAARFAWLRKAEAGLVRRYTTEGYLGQERLKRHRILRWAILQHYEVCRTPLLDVTQSLRIAASFASRENHTSEAFVFALGVPNLSGAVTASSEANLQIVRLSSACPPEAVRPHLQEGYLLGEYPEIPDYEQGAQYPYFEMDFGRRLIAKFRFHPVDLWKSKNFTSAPEEALYPKETRDPLLNLTQSLRDSLGPPET